MVCARWKCFIVRMCTIRFYSIGPLNNNNKYKQLAGPETIELSRSTTTAAQCLSEKSLSGTSHVILYVY